MRLEPRPGWQQDAACVDVDTEVFFDDARVGVARAKRVCADCPVATDCLAAALQVPFDDDHGVWGGMSRRGRDRLRKRLVAKGMLEKPARDPRYLPADEPQRERGGRPVEAARWLPHAPAQRDLARASA